SKTTRSSAPRQKMETRSRGCWRKRISAYSRASRTSSSRCWRRTIHPRHSAMKCWGESVRLCRRARKHWGATTPTLFNCELPSTRPRGCWRWEDNVPSRKYKCTNVAGGCEHAFTKELIEIEEGVEFECPNKLSACGAQEITGKAEKGPGWPLWK